MSRKPQRKIKTYRGNITAEYSKERTTWFVYGTDTRNHLVNLISFAQRVGLIEYYEVNPIGTSNNWSISVKR